MGSSGLFSLGLLSVLLLLVALADATEDNSAQQQPLATTTKRQETNYEKRQRAIEDTATHVTNFAHYLQHASGKDVVSHLQAIQGDWATALYDALPAGIDVSKVFTLNGHLTPGSTPRQLISTSTNKKASTQKKARGPALTNDALPTPPWQTDQNAWYNYVEVLYGDITLDVSAPASPVCYIGVVYDNNTASFVNRTFCNATTPSTQGTQFTSSAAVPDTFGGGQFYKVEVSWDFLGGLYLALNALQLTLPAITFGCDSAPEGAAEITCALKLAVNVLILASDEVLDEAKLQDNEVRYAWVNQSPSSFTQQKIRTISSAIMLLSPTNNKYVNTKYPLNITNTEC